MITFSDVLQSAGVDPGHVRLARHQDSRIRGRSIYAVWTSPGGQELVEEYQAVQARKVFEIGGLVASFVVTPPPRNETLFIGLYEVRALGTCEPGQRDPINGTDVSGYHKYELVYDSRLDEYKGRLAVDWGPGTRTWVQLTAHQPKPVRALHDQEDPAFPGFSQLCVDVEPGRGCTRAGRSGFARSRASTYWSTKTPASSMSGLPKARTAYGAASPTTPAPETEATLSSGTAPGRGTRSECSKSWIPHSRTIASRRSKAGGSAS